MKKYILLLVVIVSVSLFAQDSWYYVIQVKGVVVNATTKKPVKGGDKLRSVDMLDFKEPNAVIKVINPNEGIFNLSPNYLKEGKGKELQYLVKAVMSPLLGSTTAILYKKQIDLDVPIVVDALGESSLWFGEQDVEMYPAIKSNEKYFLVYTYKGKEYSESLNKGKKSIRLYAGLEKALGDDIRGPLSIDAKIIMKVKKKKEVYHSFTIVVPEKKVLSAEIDQVLLAMRESNKDEEDLGWVLGEILKVNYPGCKFDFRPYEKWLKKYTKY
ncbi:MAG: hypothetical protein AB9882_05945 [Ignavibacteriaceae bacterium]